jgi:hypothetical protein
MLLVFFDELFDNFFYEFIDEFFDESFDKVFDEFKFSGFLVFWRILFTYNFLTIASFRILQSFNLVFNLVIGLTDLPISGGGGGRWF